MNVCPEYEEIILLDLYGELDPIASTKLDTHLAACKTCRRERLHFHQLLQKVKEETTPPPLSEGQVEGLAHSIYRNLLEEKKERVWYHSWISRPVKLIPAMVSLCLLIIAFSLFSFRTQFLHSPNGVSVVSEQGVPGEIQEEDREILRNLDFLRHMDAIEKIVRIMDENEDDLPGKEDHPDFEGMDHDENKPASI